MLKGLQFTATFLCNKECVANPKQFHRKRVMLILEFLKLIFGLGEILTNTLVRLIVSREDIWGKLILQNGRMFCYVRELLPVIWFNQL